VLSQSAAAVSVIGTDCMIKTSVAAKLTAMPTETTVTLSTSCATEESRSTRAL
jgi:hypothetical protein